MFLVFLAMALVFVNGEVVFMQEGIANGELAPNPANNRDPSTVNRFRENRRRRRDKRQASSNPLVFRPRAPRLQIQPPPAPAAREVTTTMMRFLFEKQLQRSDVRPAGRIVIPKRHAEMYLPNLVAKEGLWIHMNDIDFGKVWTIRFRYWPNNSSRMYVFENAREFVKVHRLDIGDFIMVFKDDATGSYVLRSRKNVEQVANDTMNANLNSNATYFPTLEENGSPFCGDNIFDYLMNIFNETTPDLGELELSPNFESFNRYPSG